MRLWSWQMRLNLPRSWLLVASPGGLPPPSTHRIGASGASGLSRWGLPPPGSPRLAPLARRAGGASR
eukprot:3670219-Alexandrium_andersonii.AAC.1